MDPVDLGCRALTQAILRVDTAGDDPEQAQIAAAEAVLWARALIDELRLKKRTPLLRGIAYLGDRIMHGIAGPLHMELVDIYTETYQENFGVLLWADSLPEPTDGKLHTEDKEAYELAVARRPVLDALIEVRDAINNSRGRR